MYGKASRSFPLEPGVQKHVPIQQMNGLDFLWCGLRKYLYDERMVLLEGADDCWWSEAQRCVFPPSGTIVKQSGKGLSFSQTQIFAWKEPEVLLTMDTK